MELKILCPCGSKYKFDIEPLNGKLPSPVYCPVCNADGTALGNQLLAEMLAESEGAPATVSSSSAIRIGGPSSKAADPRSAGFATPSLPRSSKDFRLSTPVAAGSDVTPASNGSRLSLSGAHAAPSTVTEASPLPSPPVPGPIPSLRQGRASDMGPSVQRGIVGAALGGIAGMVVWAGLIVVTNWEIGWVAWGVGAFTGYCARMIGRGTAPQIGMAAAISALVAILAGQFLAVRHGINSFVDQAVKLGYQEEIESAKEAVALANDQEVRAFLAKANSDDETTVRPEDVTQAQLIEFKQNLPKYKRMAAGQYSRGEYEREYRAAFGEVFTTGFIFKNSFSFFTLLWIFLGVGSAYRLGAS